CSSTLGDHTDLLARSADAPETRLRPTCHGRAAPTREEARSHAEAWRHDGGITPPPPPAHPVSAAAHGSRATTLDDQRVDRVVVEIGPLTMRRLGRGEPIAGPGRGDAVV